MDSPSGVEAVDGEHPVLLAIAGLLGHQDDSEVLDRAALETEGDLRPVREPTDVLVRITTTNICGSDLHMYEGRTALEPGMVLGHENMGEVVEVGNGVRVPRSGTWSACRSTSAVGSAATARTGSPRTA